MKVIAAARVTTVSLSLLLAVGQSTAQSFTRPVPGRGVGVNTLVVYTHTRPAYSLADGLESLKLRLHRVTTRLETAVAQDCEAAPVSRVAPKWGLSSETVRRLRVP